MNEAAEAWMEVRRAVQKLARVALTPRNFSDIEAIVHAEVADAVREAADEWDDKARWRALVTSWGLESVIEFSQLAASNALRKYLGTPR